MGDLSFICNRMFFRIPAECFADELPEEESAESKRAAEIWGTGILMSELDEDKFFRITHDLKIGVNSRNISLKSDSDVCVKHEIAILIFIEVGLARSTLIWLNWISLNSFFLYSEYTG